MMRGHWISQTRKLNRHYQSVKKSKSNYSNFISYGDNYLAKYNVEQISYGAYYLDIDVNLICYGNDYKPDYKIDLICYGGNYSED